MDASLPGDGNLALELKFNSLEQNIKDYLDTKLDAFKHDFFRALRLKDTGNETGQQTDPVQAQTLAPTTFLPDAEQLGPASTQPPAAHHQGSLPGMEVLINASKRALDNAWWQLHANNDKSDHVKKIMPDDFFHNATQKIKKVKELMDTEPHALCRVYEEVLLLFIRMSDVLL